MFFDSNVILYLFGDHAKAARAEELIDGGGTISVQVLNEVANVLRRRRRTGWPEIREIIGTVREVLEIVPLTLAVHDDGIRLAERYQLAMYDAMIVAAALAAGCDTLWSEDMHDGLFVDGRLTIRNPFV